MCCKHKETKMTASLLELETLVVFQDAANPKIARVMLNRPQRRNALNTKCLQDICDAFYFLQSR